MKPPAALMETAIYADDLDAAEAFYRDVFGLEVVRRLPGQFVFFKCGRQMLLVFDPQQSRTATPTIRSRATAPPDKAISVLCEDKSEVDDWKARFEELGILIEHYHRWPNDSYSVYIRDPAGNSVEVGEGRLWGFE